MENDEKNIEIKIDFKQSETDEIVKENTPTQENISNESDISNNETTLNNVEETKPEEAKPEEAKPINQNNGEKEKNIEELVNEKIDEEIKTIKTTKTNPQSPKNSIEDLSNKEHITFNLHKMLYGTHDFLVDEIIETVKSELKEENYNELINITFESKFKSFYEIYAIFVYYFHANRCEVGYQKIFNELNIDEQLLVYIYTIMYANNEKNKKVIKEITNVIKNKYVIKNNMLYPFYKLCLNKNTLFSYTEVDKQGKLKKLYKVFKKHQSKLEKYTEIENSLVRYIFRSYTTGKIQCLKKFYNKIEFKLTDSLRLYCLLKLALGYAISRKYKEAKKYYQSVLSFDNENFDALEGIFLAENKCARLDELAYYTKIIKAKGYKKFIEKVIDLNDDVIKQRIKNYETVQKRQREDKIFDDLKFIRKNVTVISFVFMLIFDSLAYELGGVTLKVLFFLSVAIFIGSGFINNKLKSGIAGIIVRAIIGLGILVSSLLLLFI